MKAKHLLLGAIFAFSGLMSQGQVQEMLTQGFETGESANYTVAPSGNRRWSTTIYNGGQRSVKLVQSTTGEVELLLDTLDFTQNTTLRYIALYFDHICRVPQNSSSDNLMGLIYYRRPNQSDWTACSSQEYNISGSYTPRFNQQGGFNEQSYADGSWYSAMNATVDNDQWRSERFDLDNAIPASVAPNERKLLIKFVLRRRTLTSTLDTANVGWWLDNIRINASSERMVAPRITMLDYPDALEYPHTRGVRVRLQATTSVQGGINPDSVYLYYTAGSDPTQHKLMMPLESGTTNIYSARIPFFGYDTLMRFYCVVRDATGNANMATFPAAMDSWVDYRCIRGNTEQPGVLTTPFTGTVVNAAAEFFPMPDDADHRCEIVYDSALMAEGGYGPGAITAMRFTLGANLNTARTHTRIQIKMGNVPSGYTHVTDGTYYYFTSDMMQTVYDGPMTIPVLTAGLDYTINFQDTFFYAGNDVRVQITYDGNADFPQYLNMKMLPTVSSRCSFFSYNASATYGYNPFTSDAFVRVFTANSSLYRPAFVFYESHLLPLLYDAGISELVGPNYNDPMTQDDHSLTVKLKNYGAEPFTAVRISYRIDDNVQGHYDWTGNLSAGQETTVQVSPNVPLAAGFHRLSVWVQDTVTAAAGQFRDHEPLNDTLSTDFIVCAGPMSGVRTIGGANADFATIDEFLFSLSRCGMDDSLVVRLAPGSYTPFVMPTVSGLTEQHYLVFESMGATPAVIYSDSTLSATSIVDLSATADVRFRNVKFVRRNGALTDMVTLGMGSSRVRFEGCQFLDSLPNPPAALRIASMLNTGYASHVTVEGCTFNGGRVGVDIKGQAPDIRSYGNVVRNSTFNNQYENAVKVENQDSVVIADNEMYDVYSNAGYVLQLNTCYTVLVESNKIYTSHGAGGVGVSDVIGTSSSHSIVANNMVVCADDGTANLQRSPFNIIQANYVDVVYNSVQMRAPTRNNVAAATFGGGTLHNSRFVNNIVVSLDNTNYALSYQPMTSVDNHLSHNVYYSAGPVLNRRGTSSYATVEAWAAVVTEDSTSISVNPNFLNGSLVDLRTYNRNIKGIGIPIAGVTVDIYDTVRGDSITCPGAFEFSSLAYDFEVEALVNPLDDNCTLTAPTELVLLIRNSGTLPYDTAGTAVLHLAYRQNNGTVHNLSVNRPIPSEDTVVYHTGAMLNMPPSGFLDATYTLRVWLSYANDPNHTNDTNVFTIISRYHPAAPTAIADSVPYATAATVVPTAGIDTWQVYNSNSAPRRRSQIYWYNDSTDTEPFHTGDTLVTEVLQSDRTYYISQRRAMPIVRITQVELNKAATAAGLSSPMPYWMVDNRKGSVQLTNIGDATAYLEGDTLMTVSPSSSLNNKVYTFGNVKIEPGQSLVVQYVGNGVTDSSLTIRTGLTPSFSYNSNVAFVYKRNGVVEDAIPFNNVITENSTQAVKWATLGVPSYVWSGTGLSFAANTSGVYRTSFNGNVGDWELSSASDPLFLGSNNPAWVRYVDQGCPGDKASVTLAIIAPPAIEVEVEAPVLPASACGLGDEIVTVPLRNYGSDTIDTVVVNYCAGADTVTEVYSGGILPYQSVNYTFTTPLNMAFASDSLVTVRAWVDALTEDPNHLNDTSVASVLSRFTPAMPAAVQDRQVQYATRDTITLPDMPGVIPVWYDYTMTAVDTGYTHITELLYGEGTRGVAYLARQVNQAQVGTAVTTNSNTAFPSPYQSGMKFAKQQYIYSAHELRQAGLVPGNITSLNFYFDTMVGNTAAVNFLNYEIALGQITDTIFANTSAWKDASDVVFHRDVFTLTQADDHAWVTHDITPYVWDGVSSLVVQITYELTAAVSTGMRTAYTTKTNTTLHKSQNSALSPSTAGFVGAGTRGNNRPNIKFGNVVYSCEGPMSTFNVTLYGMPEHDATIFLADGTDTLTYNSCDSIDYSVMLRNQGSLDIDTALLIYSIDGQPADTTLITDTILAGQLREVPLFRRQMAPGRHSVLAHITVNGDTISSNDTLTSMLTVRFCDGTYVIAQDGTGDYTSFNAAVDSLNQVGILGPVVFSVASGTYTEQVVLNVVDGSSEDNTISFVGQTDNVTLTASTSQTANYVMMMDGVANVTLKKIGIVARPTANNVNYANALVMQNDSNILIDSCYFKVKGTIVNANASCIVLQGGVSDLTVRNSVTDSGYYAMRHAGTIMDYARIHINNNVFRNFSSTGVNLRGVSKVYVNENEFRSSNSSDSRGLIGLYLAATTDSTIVQKNQIYLVDMRKGAKRGIQLENVIGTAVNPVMVVNNMIGTYSTDSKGLSPARSAGIWIDSSSTYVNVFFNSVRVRGTNLVTAAANDVSYGFWCGNTPSNIMVMNNIFSNFSRGYAYYVSELNTVTTSNFNAYYSEATNPFAWKVTAVTSLNALQAANSMDANSVFEEPYFVADDNLHLAMTNFADKAQYNTEVIDDIDGNTRPQIPNPTIGAHEKDRLIHDLAVVRISQPEMPANINLPNNIETDSVKVVATFSNNGLSNEPNVSWYAYIVDHQDQTQSVTRNLGSLAPGMMKTDSVMVPTVLGITDTQQIRVVVFSNTTDISPDDNMRNATFFLAPAYNLSAERVEASSTETPAGCRMYNTNIRIHVKNAGSKPFPAGTSFKIGYHTERSSTSYPEIPTLPDTVEQMVTLENTLPMGSTIFFDFDSAANLYPTNTYANIKVRIKGWCNYEYDVTSSNDTTGTAASQSPIKDSYYTPASPVGHDTTLAYGTWGEVTAEQDNNRPIRWYRDSTQAPFYSPSQYNASKKWSNTPQYFHDSTYYLNCLSEKGCASEFSPVTVHLANRKTRDMAVEQVLAPIGGRVYLENDTVRVRVANYGTAAQSNIPITYQLKRGNNVLQTVHDTITQTLTTDQTVDFVFDSLLQIPTPLTQQSYSLNIWTDLANDGTRRNDTLRTAHGFSSYAQDRYNTFTGNIPTDGNSKFDITRVSFNGIDFDLPVLDRGYTNLADYTNPDYPVLHVQRGMTDSLFINVTPVDPTAQTFRCRASVYIDYNRNGYFTAPSSTMPNPVIANDESFYDNETYAKEITIPANASYGYMRMRIKVMGYDAESSDGHIIDFLLFVDPEGPASDLAITQIASPRNPLIRYNNQSTKVHFRIFNYGQDPINGANTPIFYQLVHESDFSPHVDTLHWTGTLAPKSSMLLSLPADTLVEPGTYNLRIWHEMESDVNTSNDTLRFEYHRFHELRPIFSDDFEDVNMWYAPKGRNAYTRNYWQRGMPNKTRLDTTYSGDFAWVTDLNSNIVTGKRGNVSYLYSPIINIASIRTDTIYFRMKRNLTGGSSLHMEYFSSDNRWIKVQHDSVITQWYNDAENQVFNGTSSNSEGYALYSFPTAYIRGDFQERSQFRFVYTTPLTTSVNSSFGEGCAIDDFHVTRAPRPVDVGAIGFSAPTAPQFGQTIYPEIIVKNYGTDTIREFTIGYMHYGSYLAKENEVTNCAIGPGDVDTFLFTAPFVVTSDYPDSFYITGFTRRSSDIYIDNDTTMQMFYLSPLSNDISAEQLIAPLNHVVAGDTSVRVTLRIRNMGLNPITTATASYVLNNTIQIDEQIDFVELMGHPLESFESYNYTFHHRFRATMGVMNIVSYVKSPTNDYIYNDTVTKRFEGIMSITDGAAASVIVDVSAHDSTAIAMVIENRGARGINNFQVGYWYDNDTTTMVRETYYRAEPIPALQTGYYRFKKRLPNRTNGASYNIISAFIHIDIDNDLSNDTTDVIAQQLADIEMRKVLVEENASNDCRVFLELTNIGNVAIFNKVLELRASINGDPDSNMTNILRTVHPAEVIHIQLNRRIPKSPTRQYVGTGWMASAPGDNNPTNDQTSIVEVINYMEDVPTVNGANLVLEQNYPNPFTQRTTVPFTIPNAATVRFFVMDAMGHIVYRDEHFYQAGSHELVFDMDRYAAGVYYYGIEVDGQRQMRKMILR